MARNCNCEGQCSCVVRGDGAVTVSGSGTANDPYVVSAEQSGGVVTVTDTATLDMSIAGSGVDNDPYVVSGDVSMSINGLTDVNAGSANAGDTLTFVNGQWKSQPPSTVPPGAVSTGSGLSGDGSQAEPLNVSTSGTWGTAPLDQYGADDTKGQPVYVDSNGQLRAEPKRDIAPNSERVGGYQIVVSKTDPGNPSTDRIWIQPL